MENNFSEYLTTRELATYLGVSRQWLEAGRSAGYGPPFVRLARGRGGIVRYSRFEIDRWMQEHQISCLENTEARS